MESGSKQKAVKEALTVSNPVMGGWHLGKGIENQFRRYLGLLLVLMVLITGLADGVICCCSVKLLSSKISNCEVKLRFIHIAGGLRWWCHWGGLTGQLFLKSLTEYCFALVILFQESTSQFLKFRSIGFIVCHCWVFFFCFSVSQVILKGAAVHYLLVEDLLLKLEGSVTSKWALNCGSWYSLFL